MGLTVQTTVGQIERGTYFRLGGEPDEWFLATYQGIPLMINLGTGFAFRVRDARLPVSAKVDDARRTVGKDRTIVSGGPHRTDLG